MTDRKISKAIQLLETLQQYGPGMPLEYARTFLLVAKQENLTVSGYVKLAGVPQASMSRHLLEVGDRARNKKPGMGLVTSYSDPQDLREKRYRLTEKGKALLTQVEECLK